MPEAKRILSGLLLVCLWWLTFQQVEARTALVIGNSDYRASPLTNPSNDAADMAAALEALGFAVIHKENLDKRGLVQALNEFATRLARRDEVGLFYYAGHGVEVRGRNYLIPVGTNILGEDDVEFEALEVRRVLRRMQSAGNRLNILIVDACRNNPFGRGFRRSNDTRGLARMDAPVGSFIASSTAAGEVAADGVGRNSPYTKHLLAVMREPGLSIEGVFKEVRRRVLAETNSKQIPWETTALVGNFSFVPSAPAPRPAPSPPPAAPASPSETSRPAA